MNQKFVSLSIKLIILSSRCLTPTKGLTVTQRIITKAIIDHFEIKHCILVSEGENKAASFKDHKIMSTWNVLTNIKSPKEIDFYINEYLDPEVPLGFVTTDDAVWEKSKKLLMPKTLIILQHYTLTDLSTLFRWYKNYQTAGYFTWIAFIKKSEHLTTSLHIKVPYNAEFIAIKEINTTAYELIETYKIREAQFVSHVGFWTMQKGLQTSSLSFNERRIDMNNTVLYTGLMKMSYDTILYKYHKEISDDMAKTMNTRIEVVPTVQTLVTIIEILFSMDSVNYMKEGVGPIFKVNSYLYIKEPKITGNPTYFILPFNRNLWLSLLCTLFLGSALLMIFYLKVKTELKKEKIAFIDFSFQVLETFCNQSGCVETKNMSVRTIILIMRLLMIIMFSAYSAVLLSSLIIRVPHVPFESIEELMESKVYSVGCTANSYEHWYFVAHPPGSLLRKIFDTMILDKVTNNDTVEINRVCNGNHVHVTNEHTIRLTKKINCKLFRIQNAVSTKLTSYLFHPFFSEGIVAAFSYKLHWFRSSGIIERMQRELKDWRTIKPRNDFSPVEIDHLFYLISILTMGIFLSFFLLLLEAMFKFVSLKKIHLRCILLKMQRKLFKKRFK